MKEKIKTLLQSSKNNIAILYFLPAICYYWLNVYYALDLNGSEIDLCIFIAIFSILLIIYIYFKQPLYKMYGWILLAIALARSTALEHYGLFFVNSFGTKETVTYYSDNVLQMIAFSLTAAIFLLNIRNKKISHLPAIIFLLAQFLGKTILTYYYSNTGSVSHTNLGFSSILTNFSIKGFLLLSFGFFIIWFPCMLIRKGNDGILDSNLEDLKLKK